MRTHDELTRAMLKNSAVKTTYEALAGEFALLDAMLKARQRATVTRSRRVKRIARTNTKKR